MGQLFQKKFPLTVPVVAGAEDDAPVETGVVRLSVVHHAAHHPGQVGGASREVAIFEDLDTSLKVRDHNCRIGSNLEAEDVAINLPELEEAVKKVVRKVMDGSDQRNVAGTGREVVGKSILVHVVGEDCNQEDTQDQSVHGVLALSELTDTAEPSDQYIGEARQTGPHQTVTARSGRQMLIFTPFKLSR